MPGIAWRSCATGVLALVGSLWLSPLAAQAASAGSTFDDPASYCRMAGTIDAPDARYAGPAMPGWVARALRKAIGAPASAPLDFFKQAVWRCADGQVLACSYGANIPCTTKADSRRRASAGARRFCRDNPDAEVVPAVASGRATVYEWRCRGEVPAIVKQVLHVDGQGFAKEFWYRVAPD